MKTFFTLFLILSVLPVLHTQTAVAEKSTVKLEEQIDELKQQNKQLLYQLHSLQEKSSILQQSLEERIFHGEETVSLLQEQLKLQQQLTAVLEQKLEKTNEDVTTQMSTLSNQQKTMQTVQYPGLFVALLLGFIVYIVLGRRLRSKQLALSQDMVQLGDLMSGSLETIKKDHKKAEEKIKNDLKEFSEKAKHDHDRLSNDFTVQLKNFARDSEQSFIEKIKPLELKLSTHDKSFNDYSGRIEEIKNFISEQLTEKESQKDS